MSYYIILLEILIEICLLALPLVLDLVSLVPVDFVEGVHEELHVCASPSYIFFDLLPDNIIHKILVPYGFLINTEWMIIYKIGVVKSGLFHVWNDYEVTANALINLFLFFHYLFPFGSLSRQVPDQNFPNDWPQTLDIRRNTTESKAP